MAFQVKTELVGADELKRKFDALDLSGRGAAREIINRSSLNIRNEAVRICPRDQGRLAASIGISTYNNGMTAEVSTNVGYAAFIEFGTGPRGKQGNLFRGPLPPGYVHGGPGETAPPRIILQLMRREGIRPKGFRSRPRRGSSSRTAYEKAERALAFVIARAINRRGQYARPFMYPAYLKELPNFEREMLRFGTKLGGAA